MIIYFTFATYPNILYIQFHNFSCVITVCFTIYPINYIFNVIYRAEQYFLLYIIQLYYISNFKYRAVR